MSASRVWPKISVGFFSDIDAPAGGMLSPTFAAKAGVDLSTKLTARASFKFRAGIGIKNFLPAMPQSGSCNALSMYSGAANAPPDWGATCCGAGGALPYCMGTCTNPHDTQLNFEVILEVAVSLALYVRDAWAFDLGMISGPLS